MKTLTLQIKTKSRTSFVDITADINACIQESACMSGLVCIYTPHTTAAITINENADPDVRHDLSYKINEMIPCDESAYRHCEGNSDSHLKSSLFSPSLTCIIEDGRCLLGIWQGIYFCEFDGPRNRTVHVKIIGDSIK
jgi:secondary thiamine-phosphate synthase enzyme